MMKPKGERTTGSYGALTEEQYKYVKACVAWWESHRNNALLDKSTLWLYFRADNKPAAIVARFTSGSGWLYIRCYSDDPSSVALTDAECGYSNYAHHGAGDKWCGAIRQGCSNHRNFGDLE
jgi:hypothetical protein